MQRKRAVLRNDLIEVWEVEASPLDSYDIHPAAELFPLIEGTDFDALVEDIAAHGLRQPVVLTPAGQLLDGRNRVQACEKAGVSITTRVEQGDPWEYVISANVLRRHLTNSQRSMIAAKMAQYIKPGRPKHPNIGEFPAPTQRQIAEQLNVGSSQVTAAKQVLAGGSDDLIDAVSAGEVPVHTAFRVARDLGLDEQREFLREVHLGARPAQLATRMGAGSDYACRDQDSAGKPVSVYNPNRGKYLTRGQLQSLLDHLGGLGHVVDTIGGLEPNLEPAEAARWARDLAAARRPLGRVLKMLKLRSESSP